MTQPQLAKLLNVSTTTISRWENRRNVPSARETERVEKALAEATIPGTGTEETTGASETPPIADYAFYEVVLVGLREGHVSGAEWIAVANELARARGINWRVLPAGPSDE